MTCSKSWGMDECRRATSLGSHGSWKQQVARDVGPVQILLQNDVRLAQTRAGAMLWLSTGSRPDPLLCFKIDWPACAVRTHPRHCSWERDFVGSCQNGLALKHASAFDGSLSVAMRGDASLDTGVGFTGLLGKSMPPQSLRGPCGNRLMPLPRSKKHRRRPIRCSWRRGGLSSLLHSMGLPYGAPQLRCDNRGAIALTQGEGSWRTKTLVAKMRAIQSHLKAGYITVSHKKHQNLSRLLDENLGSESHSWRAGVTGCCTV